MPHARVSGQQLMDPECVRLNRGNHESRQQNKIMGFEEEVRLRKNDGGSGEWWVDGIMVAAVTLLLLSLVSSRSAISS